ncbi:MAG: hypothetical protein VX278_02170, partial [Myxococcota bacterium]|nr:hypothetical protein [Myxococcota bacterium]
MPLLFLLACGTESVVTLPSNEAPEINITSHSDDSVLIESDLQFFRAQITDKDNRVDELLVAWFMDDQLVCDYSNPDPTSKSYCEITPNYNTSRVVAEVVDLYGESDSDQVSVFIIPNSPPEATITSPVQGGRYYTSNPILFAAAVDDEEDPSYELSVTWNSSLDGELNLSSSANDGILSEYTYLSQGQHTIAFQLVDSGGQTYTQNILIDVLGNNQEPSCDITSPLEGV